MELSAALFQEQREKRIRAGDRARPASADERDTPELAL
jgi:hypothetical protein